MTTAELIAMIVAGINAAGGSLDGDEGIDQIAEILAETAHPEFVTVMVSQDGVPVEYPGVGGFREALSDWISPYARFRLEMDEVIPVEDRILFLVRQVGTTKHDGVEIETPSASVWFLLDGTVRQANFYLDRGAAMQAAGIEPG